MPSWSPDVVFHPAEAVRKELVEDSVDALLQAVSLGAMATTNEELGPHINTVYFAFDEQFDFYFVSETATLHAQNLATDGRIAWAIWNTPEHWGEGLWGLQAVGRAQPLLGAPAEHALRIYGGRFSGFKPSAVVRDDLLSPGGTRSIFGCRIDRIRLIDELTFGRRVFISCKVIRKHIR